jgi:DNA-binding response OmpR family regulator
MAQEILIIEDETDIRELMSFHLRSEGFVIHAVESADKGIVALSQYPKISLILVDWMLPGQLSGVEFIRKLRQQTQSVPIPLIMITALSQPEHIVEGLDAGANDYLPKPFDLEVLSARVRVQFRDKNSPAKAQHIQQIEELALDRKKCRVTVHDQEIILTSTEYKILTTLAEKPGQVFTRTQLISQIQGENVHVTGRTIDTHIAGLRKKIGSAGRLVETIRGIGYRFQDEK